MPHPGLLTGRIPGLFINPAHGLFLRFLVNPAQITDTKATNYATQNIPGWEGPIRWWTHGGNQTLSFEIFLDSSESVRTLGVTPLPGLGVRPQLETIRSFLYPKVAVFDFAGSNANPASPSGRGMSKLTEEFGSFFDLPTQYVSPPDVFFIYGVRWWRTKLTSAPVVEQNFDEALTPTQVVISITLTVQEFGSLHRVMTRQRQFLALVGSGQDYLTTIKPENVASIFGSIGEAAGIG